MARKKRFRWVVRALAIAAVIPVAIGQLGRISEHADVFNSGLLGWAAALIVIFIVTLAYRDRIAMGTAMIGAAVALVQLGAAIGDGAPSGEPSPRMLRVLTLNVYERNPRPGAVAELLTRTKPDVVMLQEAGGTVAPLLVDVLPGYFRLRSCDGNSCSLNILSRWPMSRVTLPTPASAGGLPDLLVANVAMPGHPFRVVTLHLPRMTRGRSNARASAILADNVLWLHDLPLIAGGDFNVPTGSFALAEFQRDSGLFRIDGFIATYPADSILPPLVAIDHLFADAHWQTSGCERLPDAGSDHRGLICGVELKPRS